MIKKVSRNELRKKRHARIRNKISGTAEVPRLSVYKSNKNIYAQIINDETHETLVSASSLDKEITEKDVNNKEVCAKVGEMLAKRAKDANIEKVVFDRSGYVYHGKIKTLADAARSNGLNF